MSMNNQSNNLKFSMSNMSNLNNKPESLNMFNNQSNNLRFNTFMNNQSNNHKFNMFKFNNPLNKPNIATSNNPNQLETFSMSTTMPLNKVINHHMFNLLMLQQLPLPPIPPLVLPPTITDNFKIECETLFQNRWGWMMRHSWFWYFNSLDCI